MTDPPVVSKDSNSRGWKRPVFVWSVVCVLLPALLVYCAAPKPFSPRDIRFPNPAGPADLIFTLRAAHGDKARVASAALMTDSATYPLGEAGDPMWRTYWSDPTTVNICSLRPNQDLKKGVTVKDVHGASVVVRVTRNCGPRSKGDLGDL